MQPALILKLKPHRSSVAETMPWPGGSGFPGASPTLAGSVYSTEWQVDPYYLEDAGDQMPAASALQDDAVFTSSSLLPGWTGALGSSSPPGENPMYRRYTKYVPLYPNPY